MKIEFKTYFPLKGMALLLGIWIAYGLMFLYWYSFLGFTISLIGVFSVALLGWFFGIGIGIAAGILLGSLDSYFYYDVETVTLSEDVLGFLFEVGVGWLSGWLGNFQRKTSRQKDAALSALNIKDFAVDSAISAIAILDLNTNLTFVNRSFLKMWGYKRESEVLGKSFIDFWKSPDQATKALNILNVEESWIGDLVGSKKDDTPFDAQLAAHFVKNSKDLPISIMASFLDITDRKYAEATLKEREEKYRLITENTLEIIWASDNNLNFTFVNSVVLLKTGYSVDEWVGSNLSHYVAPESFQNAIIIASKALEDPKNSTGFKFEAKFFHKNGSQLHIEVNGKPILDRNFKVVGFQGTAFDITDRKKAELALEKSEEKYRLIADNMDDIVSIVSLDTMQTTYVNPSIRKLGFTEAEAKALPLKSATTPKSMDRISNLLAMELERDGKSGIDPNRTIKYELEQVTKDRRIVVNEVSTSILRDDNNKPHSILNVIRDITEKKKLDELKKQKEIAERAKDSISEWINYIAHELRGPVGHIASVFTFWYR